jgi:hypothetical protein
VFADTDPDVWWEAVRASIAASYDDVRAGRVPEATDPATCPGSAEACAATAAIVLAESQGLRAAGGVMRLGGGPW